MSIEILGSVMRTEGINLKRNAWRRERPGTDHGSHGRARQSEPYEVGYSEAHVTRGQIKQRPEIAKYMEKRDEQFLHDDLDYIESQRPGMVLGSKWIHRVENSPVKKEPEPVRVHNMNIEEKREEAAMAVEIQQKKSIVESAQQSPSHWPSLRIGRRLVRYEEGARIKDSLSQMKKEMMHAQAMKLLYEVGQTSQGLARITHLNRGSHENPLALARGIVGRKRRRQLDRFSREWDRVMAKESQDSCAMSNKIRYLSYEFIRTCGLDVTNVNSWVALFREVPTLHGFFIHEKRTRQIRDMYAGPLLAMEVLAAEVRHSK